MGAITGQAGNGVQKSYERCDAGSYAARCIQVIELGTQKKEFKGEVKYAKEIMLTFELSGELMQDGRPFVVSWRGTNSLNEKSTFYKLLTNWRGKAFTPEQLRKFELSNVLDVPCMINISKDIAKSGKEYNKVLSCMPLPKGMICEPRINDIVDFGINDIGSPEFDKLYPYVQTIVLESNEGKAYTNQQSEFQEEAF